MTPPRLPVLRVGVYGFLFVLREIVLPLVFFAFDENFFAFYENYFALAY